MTSTTLPDDELAGGRLATDKGDEPMRTSMSTSTETSLVPVTGNNVVPLKGSNWPSIFRRSKGLPANSLSISVDDDAPHVVTYEVAEQMRLLMARAKGKRDPQCLAVTSTVVGEGSSYIARSLAAVIAHDSDLRVCLLEVNWDAEDAEESTADIDVFGVTGDGLQESGKRLTVVRTGSVSPLQRSLFVSSDSFAEDIESFREYYDMIILDLPSIGSHSGVLALSEFADRYVLVARQGVAPVAQVRAAIDDLGEQYLAGVVLNQADFDAPKWLSGLTGT